MNACWASCLTKEVPEQISNGCRIWARALNIPLIPIYEEGYGLGSKFKTQYNDYEVIMCEVSCGSLHYPKLLKEAYPNKKIVAVFDYNAIEVINILKEGNFEYLKHVDVFVAPNTWKGWLESLFGKPIIKYYRPYILDMFKGKKRYERRKEILATEHTKSRFMFSEKLIAKKICERVPGYKLIIKKQAVDIPPHYLLDKTAHPNTLNYFNLNTEEMIAQGVRASVFPEDYVLAIDHYDNPVFGNFPAICALSGTPCIGVSAQDAQEEAFPSCTFKPYDIKGMVNKGVELLTDEDSWERVGREAKEYAFKHWGLGSAKKLWDAEIIPLLENPK